MNPLPGPMPLSTFLARLIWLCVLPLALLAAYLAGDSVLKAWAARDLEAANLAKNFATAIDDHLNARIRALRMLGESPLAADTTRWNELYQEAQGFRQSFDCHVVFADAGMRMLFNTRMPFGATLPPLPRPKGHAAAPAALATGKPAVGDLFFGPLAREPMVAIAVPVRREGKATLLLLATFETRQFQRHIEKVALPAGWSLALLDGQGEAIARRARPSPAREIDTTGRFVAKSALSPWSVVLEIPRDVYRAPLLAAAAALATAVLGATLAGVAGGRLAGRRLARAVASLALAPSRTSRLAIAEIERARAQLEAAAAAREAAENERQRGEAEIRRLNADLERRVVERTAELTAANRDIGS